MRCGKVHFFTNLPPFHFLPTGLKYEIGIGVDAMNCAHDQLTPGVTESTTRLVQDSSVHDRLRVPG